MKLYYAPGACSLASHIVLREAGLDFTLDKVDTNSKRTAEGKDFLTISPHGYVPALEIEPGLVLTEGPAILQLLADKAPGAQLAPGAGTLARYQLQSWLNFITSEIHKGFSPLFKPEMPAEAKALFVEQLGKRFDVLERHLAQNDYLVGERYSIADAYLYVTTNWAAYLGISLDRWTALNAFRARVAARPAVQAALAAEGLKAA
ncbi:glutathione transferase GstA [Massilia sp. IC2-476]|uniref:glutathione transferase GstA n=1 Tax=Massilia sp. IC2-476 TaxID=2887199 RepID=UPI001D114186|nr:glutathione transferase GstA [Massilia sp. IC2-476]MCC2971013.1 glutathione transferase GstA [Massilia sp. IC2-476]